MNTHENTPSLRAAPPRPRLILGGSHPQTPSRWGAVVYKYINIYVLNIRIYICIYIRGLVTPWPETIQIHGVSRRTHRSCPKKEKKDRSHSLGTGGTGFNMPRAKEFKYFERVFNPQKHFGFDLKQLKPRGSGPEPAQSPRRS